ncbi:WD40 repeat domain-containing protein [Candidatus Jorgensenbacteria bacterium]|nr:WD40 repeat domain-containing protein [Candidatus Jorgensenbacteria bacterium]
MSVRYIADRQKDTQISQSRLKVTDVVDLGTDKLLFYSAGGVYESDARGKNVVEIVRLFSASESKNHSFYIRASENGRVVIVNDTTAIEKARGEFPRTFTEIRENPEKYEKLSAGVEESLYLVDISAKKIETFQSPHKVVPSPDEVVVYYISPHGQKILRFPHSSSYARSMDIYDRAGKQWKEINLINLKLDVEPAGWSPNGDVLYLFDKYKRNTIHVLDTNTGLLEESIDTTSFCSYGGALAPLYGGDNKMVALCNTGDSYKTSDFMVNILLFDWSNGTTTLVVSAPAVGDDQISGLEGVSQHFSEDKTKFIYTQNYKVKFLKIGSEKQPTILPFEEGDYELGYRLFSPSGSFIVLTPWDSDEENFIKTFDLQANKIFSIPFGEKTLFLGWMSN